MAHIADLIQACRVCCWPALVTLVPELKTLEGQSQHRGAGVDVAEHTRLMLVQCPKEDDVLLLACLLHDLGKPQTAEPNRKGGWQFPDHAAVGAAMVQPILERFDGVDTDLSIRLHGLVFAHMMPHGGEILDMGPDTERLIDLAELDSGSFLNRSVGKVRERFNALRVKHHLPERPFPPPEPISRALEEYQRVCLQGKEPRYDGPQAA